MYLKKKSDLQHKPKSVEKDSHRDNAHICSVRLDHIAHYTDYLGAILTWIFHKGIYSSCVSVCNQHHEQFPEDSWCRPSRYRSSWDSWWQPNMLIKNWRYHFNEMWIIIGHLIIPGKTLSRQFTIWTLYSVEWSVSGKLLLKVNCSLFGWNTFVVFKLTYIFIGTFNLVQIVHF